MASSSAAQPTLAAAQRDGRVRGSGGGRGRRHVVVAGICACAAAGFVYFVVPQLSGASATLHRLRSGDAVWLCAAVVFEALSLGSYISLFRAVFSCHGNTIRWRESYQINMAGVVATKLIAAAGAGGIALTVWALRASGLEPRTIARRMVAFELLLYAVFATALVVVGVGLRGALFGGSAPWALTIVPAGLGALAIAVTVMVRMVPGDIERRMRGREGSGRARRIAGRLASAPAAIREATAIAFELVGSRRLGVLGAVGYWAFDIATLWSCLHAFGSPPPLAVVVMAYFVGNLANALPLPGGIGGVEGGMIGALLAFGTHASLAVLGVLSYRAISFWLPTLPGAVAYARLRRTVATWRERQIPAT